MKFLVNPYLWYLLLLSAGLLVLQRSAAGRSRRVLWILLFATFLLALLSTPLSQRMLEASLASKPTPTGASSPALIFILGGGYFLGATREEDALVAESQLRVLHGVSVWRRYPHAHVVMSGADYEYQGIRGADRLGQLMEEVAANRGVPTSVISLESRSRNTREHPEQALLLPGVAASTTIAVVTSGWHMRRAKREFCRYFERVQVYPVPVRAQPVNWHDFVPDADALDSNTTLVREWVAMMWYGLRGSRGQPSKC